MTFLFETRNQRRPLFDGREQTTSSWSPTFYDWPPLRMCEADCANGETPGLTTRKLPVFPNTHGLCVCVCVYGSVITHQTKVVCKTRFYWQHTANQLQTRQMETLCGYYSCYAYFKSPCFGIAGKIQRSEIVSHDIKKSKLFAPKIRPVMKQKRCKKRLQIDFLSNNQIKFVLASR